MWAKIGLEVQVWWNRHWYEPVAAVRPLVLLRVLLTLLALDVWTLHLSRGGRYGVDGFNVAHFRWLDAWQPLPGATLYVGLCALVGLLALSLAIAGPRRLGLAMLTLLYTFSWAMSQHDSYQHHHLLSLLLFAAIFFPLPSSQIGQPRAEGAQEPAPVSAWAFVLFGTTVAITYLFAAIAKLEPEWLSGAALRHLGSLPALLSPWLGAAKAIGIAESTVWELVTVVVITCEGFLFVGYVLAPYRDRSSHRWSRAVAWVALGCAVALHGTIELVGLSLGWFSIYMLVIAAVFFLPARWLLWPTMIARTWIRRWWRPDSDGHSPAGSAASSFRPWVGAAGLALAAALLLVLLGWTVDLPGMPAASVVAAAAVLALPALDAVLGRRPSRGGPAAVLVAVVLMGLCLTQTFRLGDAQLAVRFDFYRRLGSDLSRLGHVEAALEAYEKANRYAPAGESRQQRIDLLKRSRSPLPVSPAGDRSSSAATPEDRSPR